MIDHVAIAVRDLAASAAFYARALARGAASGGAPGPREATMTTCFAAFIRDRDGNRIEAVHLPKAG